MKFAFIPGLLLISNLALACPGGDLKIVKLGANEIARVNLTKNSLLVTDPNVQVSYLGLKRSNAEFDQIICSDTDGAFCTNPQDIGIQLISDRTAVLTLQFELRNGDQHTSYLTNFMIYRGESCDRH